MLLIRKTLIFFLVLIWANTSFAQIISYPNENEAFLETFEKVFKEGKNAISIVEFETFKSNFKDNLNNEEQSQFKTLCQNMANRRYQMPEYYRLLVLLNGTFNPLTFPQESRIKLLSTLAILAEKHSLNTTISIVNQVNDLITNRILYVSNFSKLYVLNGTFDFEFLNQKQDYFKPVGKKVVVQESKQEDFGLFDDWNETDNEEEIDPWDDPSLAINPNEFYRLIPLPLISDFIVKFKDVDLVFVTKSDSIALIGTSGAADLIQNNWIGEKGVFNWNNVLIPEAKAELSEYTFKLHTPYINAEKVKFTYDKFFEQSIEGVFEFKAGVRNPKQLSDFPRFKSYENDAVFKNLENSLDYKGGFSLIGNRVFSSSVYHNISTLWVNKGLPNSFKVIGKKIEFTDSLITSDFVSFSTLIQEDSIFHPAVRLHYNLYEKDLKLYKQLNGGFRNSMFSDTFHEMDIRCDAMKWNLNTGKMDFYVIAGKSEIPAFFESFNYYNAGRLRELSNIAGFNPLIFLGNYVYAKKRNQFKLSEIEDKIAKTPIQIRNGVNVARQMGFIDLDPYTENYSLSRKGLHYFKAATRRGDYDDLVFTSVSKGGNDNASIDRNSNSLDIAGTQEFKLSDSLGIRFLPRNQSLKMEGSKSFKFEGEVVVKNYRIIGDFEVDYERFLVHLNRIDSITFTPIEIYNKGGKAEIGGHIVYGKTGTLLLNSPDNKSGRKILPQYPRLIIPDGATVTFNESSRKSFAYLDDVFFKIDKIDHDSLNTRNMAYEGMFSSGGIIPPIRETLITMPDTSIGFIHLPKVPYQLYKTVSAFKFIQPLKMTKQGLISKGSFVHLAANLYANEAYFGDSIMIFSGDQGSIKETFFSSNIYFPDVSISEYKAIWNPSDDSLIIESPVPFSFYNASTELKGGLVVRNSGLYGKGQINRIDSEAKSKAIKFNKTGFLASESSFVIKSDNKEGKPVLKGQMVEVNFNIDQQLANISPKGESFNDTLSSSISFPNAAYKSTIDQAEWNIKKRTISMKGNVNNSIFTSAAPNQYGLSFKGGSAIYDIAANTLNVNDVPGINSVDAIIVPKDGKVAIKSEGKLEPFINAIVIVDTLNKFHTLANANITINSKISYSGSASYQFVNVSSDTFNIKMGGFEFYEINGNGEVLTSKKSGKLSTIAKAKVTEKDSVFLSPKMLYIGEITMQAPFKNLLLRGQVTPTLNEYPILGSNWINYSGSKSEEITINIDETLKDGGKSLYAGLHLKPSSSTEGLYPTFLSAKGYEDDFDIFLANGVFKRDEPNKRFTIYPSDGLAVGNKYELYDEKGLIKLEGKLNLFRSTLSTYIETVGLVDIELESMNYLFNTMMKFNLPIPIPMLAKMGDNIVKTNLDVGNSEGAIEIYNPDFKTKLTQFVGKKITEDYSNQYLKGHIPLFQSSPKFYSSLMFSDLKLKWNPVFNAFHSYGKIGISNIGEVDINAQVPGYIEINKNPRTGDEMYIFLELSPDAWYYIGYKEGQMGIVSSDFEFNKMLIDKDKTLKGIELINADMSEAMAFRKRFLMSYLGVSAEAFSSPKRAIPSVPGKIEQVQIPTNVNSSEIKPANAPAKKVEVEASDGF